MLVSIYIDNGMKVKGKENGKIRMKVSVIDILYYCSMCMQ